MAEGPVRPDTARRGVRVGRPAARHRLRDRAHRHHFLAVEKVRGILGGFFGVQLLSPGLYLASAAFTEDRTGLVDEARKLADLHGRPLVELATAVRSSKWLRDLRPLI